MINHEIKFKGTAFYPKILSSPGNVPKMETNIAANNDGIIGNIVLNPGNLVNTDDLVMEIESR